MTIIIESPSRMEPCLLDEASAEIVDLVAALAGATNALGRDCARDRRRVWPGWSG